MQSKRGAILIETAISLPVLVMMLAFTVEIGLSFRDEIKLTDTLRTATQQMAGFKVTSGGYTDLECDDLKDILHLTLTKQGVKSTDFRATIEPINLNETISGSPVFSACYSSVVPALRVTAERKRSGYIFPGVISNLLYRPKAVAVFTLESHRRLSTTCSIS